MRGSAAPDGATAISRLVALLEKLRDELLRHFADEETLFELRQNNQILVRYTDEKGNASKEANPNGSAENIAGICNLKRNVFGLMPHPERASEKELGSTDGIKIFKSILEMN